VPSRVLSPFIEIRIAALWQIVTPCRFERDARGLESRRGAVSIVARLAPGIKAAAPLPNRQIEWRSGECVAALAMKRGKSVDFTGYWQRHIAE
jgi:hypothetical protein